MDMDLGDASQPATNRRQVFSGFLLTVNLVEDCILPQTAGHVTFKL